MKCPIRAGSPIASGGNRGRSSGSPRGQTRAPGRRAPGRSCRARWRGSRPASPIRDGAGDLYFIKFDPPANPEMASGAEVISTKFFYAFGYHVPENYIATVRRESIVIGEGALIDDDNGRRRQMDTRDLDALLKRVARSARWHATGLWPARRSKASRLGRSATTAHGRTTPMTSSRTSIGESSGGCSSSAPG